MTARTQILRKLRRFVAGESGTQLAELAIVLPIMLLLLAAVAEFGRFFYTYTTLAKATRAGARYLITRPMDPDVKDDAKNLIVCGDPTVTCGAGDAILDRLDVSHVEITTTGTPGVPETVTVRIVNYDYQPIFNLVGLTGSTLTLAVDVSPSTTMRYLLT